MSKEKQYAIALYQTTKNKNKGEIENIVRRLLDVIKKNGEELLIKGIISNFQKIARENGDFHYLKIITARDKNQEMLLNIDNVKVEFETNPEIIGGAIVEIDGQYLIDNSIRGKINQISKQ